MDELWFGTKQRFQWAPMPPPGVQRNTVTNFTGGTLDRGGGFASRPTGSHVEWEFNYPYRESEDLDVFPAYAAGLYNDYETVVDGFNPNNLIYFVDPMNTGTNLFPPHWASPMLGLSGDWPWPGDYASHQATTGGNGLPARAVTFSLGDAANTFSTVTRRTVVIPVPPGFTLRWGWRGARSGTGVVRAVAHHASGGSDLVQSVEPIAESSTTRIGNAVDGDTYDYVTFGFARTSSAASTVTVAGMVAQIHPNSASPVLTGDHVPGMGTTGCVFAGPMPEVYQLAVEGRHFKGLSFGLMEIGAWL